VLASVGGEEEPELGAGEEEVGIDVVLGQGVDGAVLRQVADDARPGLALVVALEEVGSEVAILVVVEGGVDGAGGVLGGEKAADVGALGDAGEALDLAPGLAGVGG